MSPPFFSIIVSTYNRERIVGRCIDSILGQAFEDFELVVVDDHSSDGTLAALDCYEDPRLRVVAHERNRGIHPSRHTGVTNATGTWVIVFDSDWELLPGALERLREIVLDLPEGIRVLRSRLVWDDGHLTPSFMPPEPIDYEGRISWAEAEGGNDALHCIHRAVFETTPFFADRRGAMETLWELELASRERSLYVNDVLGHEHTDAPNSWLRTAVADELVPRLFSDAPDMLWMAETALDRHGGALRRNGPGQYTTLLRVASVQAFLLGKRSAGMRYAVAALRRRPLEPQAWVTLALGLIGPRAVAHGTLALRRLVAWRAQAQLPASAAVAAS
ncbi:MAG TPA: glycosyltransferase family 2 protein [Solirubrobacterales bacterium]|nr:glycosyltransferase family 2 protein [Solirubrobacterales bacterium]